MLLQYSLDGGIKNVRNVGKFLPDYMAQHHRIQSYRLYTFKLLRLIVNLPKWAYDLVHPKVKNLNGVISNTA
jgi:hypothetical protein